MSKRIDADEPPETKGPLPSPDAPTVQLAGDATLGFSAFLRRMVEAGWRLEAPEATAPGTVTVCFVAHPPDRDNPHLVYGYGLGVTLSVEDLWRIVTDARASSCTHALMVVPPQVALSGAVRDTAARLNVRILRLAG